jgi:hypothetical protein
MNVQIKEARPISATSQGLIKKPELGIAKNLINRCRPAAVQAEG